MGVKEAFPAGELFRIVFQYCASAINQEQRQFDKNRRGGSPGAQAFLRLAGTAGGDFA